MTASNISVETTETGGQRVSVYGGCTCHFLFEPVEGEEKTLREDNSVYEGCANENEENIGFAYRRASTTLQELGFRVDHPQSRQRHIRR